MDIQNRHWIKRRAIPAMCGIALGSLGALTTQAEEKIPPGMILTWKQDPTYKRTVPIYQGVENAERGILYIGDGSWGVAPRPVHSVEDTWYLERAESVRHSLVITVHPDRKVVDAINNKGEKIDTITIPARGAR